MSGYTDAMEAVRNHQTWKGVHHALISVEELRGLPGPF